MPRRTLAATVALTLLTILASPLAAQETQISFTTTEGTWVSLDVAPDGGSLVFELLGDVYVLPVEGGRARPVLTGSAFQSQPRFSPDGRLLAYVSKERVRTSDVLAKYGVTISSGIARSDVGKTVRFEELIQAADQQMYENKNR
ncbi:MAG TPA: hypothetical protein EYQ64_06680 [Gemmatimonadetes bacterium]|nr:hypothetical protein [Gemmatimonadota bacterium]